MRICYCSSDVCSSDLDRRIRESAMPIVYVDGVEDSHMRFVFTDAVVSLPLAEDATFQDGALTCRDLTRRHHGALVSIVVALKLQEAESADSMTALPSQDPEPRDRKSTRLNSSH